MKLVLEYLFYLLSYVFINTKMYLSVTIEANLQVWLFGSMSGINTKLVLKFFPSMYFIIESCVVNINN
jgi:hypothetical protein